MYLIRKFRTERPLQLSLLAIILGMVLTATLQPYRSNITALFHMDTQLEEAFDLPAGFVVLDVPAYDGAQYERIARNIPRIANPSEWAALFQELPLSYAYQRILLPLAAFLLAFGRTELLPVSFLLIQILSLLGSAWLILKKYPKAILPAFALALSPAAMVGLHFSLAEPLTILLFTMFLLRFQEKKSLDAVSVLLLCLIVLAREVNVLFIDLLFLWFAWKRQWKSMLLTLIPGLVFIGWHAVIYGIFGDIPFLLSAGKRTLPLGAVIELLTGQYGFNKLTYSSIALFLGFVLPAVVWILLRLFKHRDWNFLPLATLAFLGLMLTMPDHIWGSITSIGRVITPVYPLFVMTTLSRSGRFPLFINVTMLILGLSAAIGLALSIHPYHLA